MKKEPFKINYSVIPKIKWWRWAGESNLYFPCSAFRAKTAKFYGGFALAVYYKNNYLVGFENIKENERIARDVVKKQRLNRKYIDELIVRWRKMAQERLQLFKELDKLDLKTIPAKQLLSLQRRLAVSRCKMWQLAFIIEVFDATGDTLLSEAIEEFSLKDLKSQEIQALLSSQNLTYLQKEKLELLKIALKKLQRQSPVPCGTGQSINQALKEHARRYFYIRNNWRGTQRLTEKHFRNEMGELMKRGREKAKEQIGELSNYSQTIKRKQAGILQKHKIPREARNVFYLFSRMTEWREKRKQFIQISNHYADKLLSEMARRNKASKKALETIDPLELKSLEFSKEYLSELKRRQNGCIFIFDKNNHYKFISGQEANRALQAFENTQKPPKDLKEIKGVSAMRGKVKGKAKIIFTSRDFAKIEKGDVLVVSMTRPEFMPVLKKVSAIITDEGGITCHAAIISREMQKPCIISAKIATKVLKDGDMVEVDADKGVVKIIK